LTRVNVLFTGASSPLGAAVLANLLRSATFDEVWCTVHRRGIALESPKLHEVAVDLTSDFTLDAHLSPIDLLVHFASVTHARDPADYHRVNVEGSLRLVEQSRQRGCRQMFYVSTRCVGPKEPKKSCGAYAESKRALEDALLKMEWDSLVIVRPAEIYGAGGTEGIDQFVHLARSWRVVPLLFGAPGIRFAPLHYKDFVQIATRLLDAMPRGVHIHELCGPQSLDGTALARMLAKRFGAVPIPVWYPLLVATLRGLHGIGISLIAPDQLDRLVGDKSAETSSAALLAGASLTLMSDQLDC
jgi:nucleoside-diphosphate-sugar epimerase